MAASSPYASVYSNRSAPPRRGRIKARIFKSLIKKVAAAVLIKRNSAPMDSEEPRSDVPIIPTTPPLSSCSSNG